MYREGWLLGDRDSQYTERMQGWVQGTEGHMYMGRAYSWAIR